MSLRRRALLSQGGLPSEYQEVEYLKSTATQYIDTGVIPDNTTGLKIKMAVQDVTSDLFRFGCRQTTGETRFIIGTKSGYVYYGFGTAFEGESWGITVNDPFECELNYKNSRVAKTNNLGEKSLPNISDITFTYSLIMFGRNSVGTISASAQTIYHCKISRGNSIIREFVPVKRKSDNKPGMYDLCGSICPLTNSPFYVNAGTGEFTVGPDVN